MNYFELYPGDYLRDTTRLTLVEHGAYLRLLMAYYAEEEALPCSFDELFTIAGATKSAEKEAVKKVADKFFPVASDGLRHNGRADEEISKASARMDGADERRSNDAERKKRSRERRAELFRQLRALGVIPDFDAKASELERLLSQANQRDGARDVTRDSHKMSRDVTRDSTATRPQTPDPIKEQEQKSTHAPPSPPDLRATAPIPTEAGRACLLMRKAGCAQVNPSHPDLVAALAEGVTPQTLGDTAAEGVAAGKSNPFAWAIATARSRHAEGPSQVSTGPPRSPHDNGSSKTLDAIQTLQGLKIDDPLHPRLAPERDSRRLEQAHDVES